MTEKPTPITEEQLEQITHLTLFYAEKVNEIMGTEVDVVCVGHVPHAKGEPCIGSFVLSDCNDINKVVAIMANAVAAIGPKLGDTPAKDLMH